MNRIIEITDWWLWALDKDGQKYRAWIKGKYMYFKSHDNYKFSNGYYGFATEKYRYLGKCTDKMAHRIATLKTDSFAK